MKIKYIETGMDSALKRRAIRKRYRSISKYLSGRGIDIGCGSGIGLPDLDLSSVSELVAIDTNPKLINKLQHSNLDSKIKFGTMDALKMKFKNDTFDFVICFELYEHFEEPEKLTDSIHRILKPGGYLFLSTPNRRMGIIKALIGTKNPFHCREYTSSEMKERLSKKFTIIKLLPIFSSVINFPLSEIVARLYEKIMPVPLSPDLIYVCKK